MAYIVLRKMSLYDKRAVKILFSTYWTSTGWKSPRELPSEEDYSYAISNGIMFEDVFQDHDSVIKSLRKLCKEIPRKIIGDAFLSSLSTRELALRSAFGTYSIASHLPKHSFEEHSRMQGCVVCGQRTRETLSLNVLNFERLKWGGVRHTNPGYQLFDLTEFSKLDEPKVKSEDIKILSEILAMVNTLDCNATANQFSKSLNGIFSSNSAERATLVGMLCRCGILSYDGFENYFHPGDPPSDRPYRDTDWDEVSMNWRAKDGFRLSRIEEYFPEHAEALCSQVKKAR